MQMQRKQKLPDLTTENILENVLCARATILPCFICVSLEPNIDRSSWPGPRS